MIRNETFRDGRLAAMGIYAVGFASVLGGSLRDKEVTAVGMAVGLVTVVGFVVAWASHIRTRRLPPRTIRGYFREVQFLFTHLTLSLSCLFAVLWFIPAFIRSGHGAEPPAWYLPLLAAVAIHQYIRGARRIVTRWRTVDHVLLGLRGARTATERFSAKYDLAFFICMSIGAAIAGRFFGSGGVLLIGGLIGALSLPFVMGLAVTQRVVLARLIPNDLPLPPDCIRV